MDVILQTGNDDYTEAGYRYFLSKYGFSSGSTGETLPLKISRSLSPPAPGERITGWISYNGSALPVLVPPSPLTGEGTPLLTYSSGSTQYPCSVRTDEAIVISLDIFRHLGLFLSGHLEKIWVSEKERRKEIIAIPFADYYSDFLFSCIRTALDLQNVPLVHKTFWPGGKPYAICLTHDVDEVKKTYQWITRPWNCAKNLNRQGLLNQCLALKEKLRGKEPYWTFESLMQMEDALGVRSSFYFLHETAPVTIGDRNSWRHLGRRYNWDSPPVKNIMRLMVDGGWEVGLHGSFFSYIDPEKLAKEKNALEHALGSCISGGRQHNLNFQFPETWLGQEKSGLSYDSTLGYNDSIGFRWGTCLPFHPYLSKDQRTLNLLEIPLIIEDLPFFIENYREGPAQGIIQKVTECHGVLTLLWHHTVFDDHEYPGWGDDYLRIIGDGSKCGAWIATAGDIAEWWLRRESSDFTERFDGRMATITAVSAGMPRYFTVFVPKNLKLERIKHAKILQHRDNVVMLEAETSGPEECITIEFSLQCDGS